MQSAQRNFMCCANPNFLPHYLRSCRLTEEGDLKLLHRIVKFIIYGNLCKFIQNHKKCFFSFISQPILIVIALFGRAELRTLNLYTEF